MNQRNHTIDQFSQFYQKDETVKDIFYIEKINIFKNINSVFINQMIKEISFLTNQNIYLSSYSMKIGLDNDSIKMIESLTYFNLIEILPYKNQLYTVFSSSMLFIIIDILFGGNNKHINCKNKNVDITSTEVFVNQKLIELFKKAYSDAWKNFFSIDINLIDIKKNKDLNKSNFFLQEKIIIHRFLLKMNQIRFYFCVLTPISILNLFNKNKYLFFKNSIPKCTLSAKPISIKNISYIKFNIIVQLMDFSVSEKNIFTLSVGDVLSIDNPKKIIAYIDNKPIFLGYYAELHKKSCIIIEKFINIQSTIKEKKYYHE
ncbi:FliM/FliN family flagellar motor switch protein [Buchnera aphidicola]|uniref:FliM/FliN family flagellar motor switch protein n=1 Tax=Buchnera aphidicola TaxID=9 RepID=UPI003464E7D2